MAPSGSYLATSTPVRLVEGTELLGHYRGSGAVEVPYLIRRADRRVVEVSELLYLLASSVDGVRRPGDIAAVVSAGLGRRVSSADVDLLIARKLRPLGVVEGSEEPSPARPAVAVLAPSIRAAVVPRPIVDWAATRLCPLFRPAVVGSAVALLVAVDVWLILRHGLGRGTDELLYRPPLLLMAAALTVLAGGFHELGHATGCRYGGAEPGVIGVGIYLVWPVFYNDLNDSYRLTRRGRLRADLGGLYFNVLFILLLAGAYGLTGFQPLVVVLAVQHLLMVRQVVPFVRLDGYYVVSDLAGVPDLYRHVRPVLLRLVRRTSTAPGPPPLRPGPRAVVTAWVLVTIPLLAACVLLLAVRLPGIVTTAWDSARLQSEALAAALRGRAPVAAAASGLQLVLLAVPFVGLGAAVLRGAALLGRWRRGT